MTAALITGVSGTSLTPEERGFLKDVKPAGLILFSRNCETREQIAATRSRAVPVNAEGPSTPRRSERSEECQRRFEGPVDVHKPPLK